MTRRDWTDWEWGEPQIPAGKAWEEFGRQCADLALDGLHWYLPALYRPNPKAGRPPKNPLVIFASNTERVAKPVLQVDIVAMLREEVADCRRHGGYADQLEKMADELDKLSAEVRRGVKVGRSKESKRGAL